MIAPKELTDKAFRDCPACGEECISYLEVYSLASQGWEVLSDYMCGASIGISYSGERVEAEVRGGCGKSLSELIA